MAQPSVQGSFVWQELMAADTAAAGAFYPRILGWRTQSSPHSADYTMFAAASGPIAGMMRLPDDARQAGARPHWLPYVGADDVDATVASAERLGAKVLHAASDIAGGVGRFAVLSDPQGAAFGVFRPGQPMQPAAAASGSGSFCWHELASTDAEAAFDFYSKLFGWQAMQRMDMGPAGTYLIFGRDGNQRGGMYKLSPHMPMPYWLSYVEVASADAVAAAARLAGARIVNGPMDVPGGRIAQMMDPNGILFAVHSTAKAQVRPSPDRKPAATPASTTHQAPAAAKAQPERPASRPQAMPAPASSRGDGKPAVPAAAKKAPAKKAATKKAAAKKAAVRKAPSRKSTAKKAAKGAKKKVSKKVGRKVGRKIGKKASKKRGAAKRSSAARARMRSAGARSSTRGKRARPGARRGRRR